MKIIDGYRKWKAHAETEMEALIDRIVQEGELLSTVSYGKPGDDCDNLWHLDIYECEGKVYKIIYTDYMYVDLELLGSYRDKEDGI